jgi:membrane associated rhomboid family serine protease
MSIPKAPTRSLQVCGAVLEWVVMSSGADLFVVCKQCGSEVSPYITECPYCGHRLRRRAPKLPREGERQRSGTGGLSSRLRRHGAASSTATVSRRRTFGGALAVDRPYVTILIVAISVGLWVAWEGGFVRLGRLVVAGPLEGEWWRLFTSQFAYVNGWNEFATLLAVAIFGWLVERRHGPWVALAVFLGAGATGALVASAIYADPLVSGGNAGALGLLAVWAVPDLEALRTGDYYEGDLLGTGVIAALLLAMPLARFEVSWVAGVTGGLVGLLVGLGITRMAPREA